jgi:hypothetical protein
MTVSIGISTWTSAVEMSLEQLLFAADKALYQAKHSGRNRIGAERSLMCLRPFGMLTFPVGTAEGCEQARRGIKRPPEGGLQN